VAKTRCLIENLVLLSICTMTNTPLILVGKPGISKTLVIQILDQNLNSETSNRDFHRYMSQIRIISFQCSKLTTSQAIEERWDFAVESQSAATDDTKYMLLLDELGLAEQSGQSSLKVLHKLLENDPRIACVGISNTPLDAAKMNRVVLGNCQNMDRKGLLETANAIINGENFVEDRNISVHDYIPELHHIVDFFCAFRETQPCQDFYGNRDFFGLVRYLYVQLKKDNGSHLRLPQDLILKGIFRNFGGMDQEFQKNFKNGKQSFTGVIAEAFHFPVSKLNKFLADSKWKSLAMIRENHDKRKSKGGCNYD
jgi:hypothetical protein